jgi:hypothetical protein
MIATINQETKPAGVQAVRKRYTGEVVYLYAYDVAYEMSREPIRRLLGQPVEPFQVDDDKRIPRHQLFYRPQMVRLPAVERVGPHGTVRMEREVKVLPVGAISITIRVPFEVERIDELVVYHDLQLNSGTLNDEVRQLAELVRGALEPFCVRPVAHLQDEEAYTVFCLETSLSDDETSSITAEGWLKSHRREIAALLTQESDTEQLSPQEVEESTGRFLSYYRSDLVVIDWNAALILDEPEDFDETLYVMELANLQLAELEAYDRMLDQALERSYRDVLRRSRRRRSSVLKEVKELRIDLARLSDELSNITKFFGDWHLARVYESVAARFHLSDWHRAVDEKLKTLHDLYQVLNHDQNNQWMLLLEVTIVLLFVIDLVMLFLGVKGR